MTDRAGTDNDSARKPGKESVKEAVMIRDTDVPDHGLPTKASS